MPKKKTAPDAQAAPAEDNANAAPDAADESPATEPEQPPATEPEQPSAAEPEQASAAEPEQESGTEPDSVHDPSNPPLTDVDPSIADPDDQPVTFTDAAEDDDPEQSEQDGQDSDEETTEHEAPGDGAAPDGQEAKPEEEPAPDEPKAPTADTLSFHIHRIIATGRTVITVKTADTDPYYHSIPSLPSLEEAIAQLPALHQSALGHWQETPRYPENASVRPANARPAAQPAQRRPQPEPQKPKETQQASLF